MNMYKTHFSCIIIHMKIITFVLCILCEPNIFQLFLYWLDNIVLNISEMLHWHTDHIEIFHFPYEYWEWEL